MSVTAVDVEVALHAQFDGAGSAVVTGIGASPGAALELWTMNSAIDVRDVLPSVRVPCLVLRVANQRNTHLMSAAMELSAVVEEVTVEGHEMRRVLDLKLVRSTWPILATGWTVIHRMDESSPLHGLTPDNVEKRLVMLLGVLKATDAILLHEVHAWSMWRPSHLRWGVRFQAMSNRSDEGVLHLDYTTLGRVEPLPPQDGSP